MFSLTDACHANAAARGRLCACLHGGTLGRLRSLTGDLGAAAATRLFTPGAPADHLFGLRQGMVMLSSQMPDGRRQVLAFLLPGDIFGFTADSIHHETATALERSSFCRFGRDDIEADPELSERLHQVARRQLLDAHDRLLCLGRMTAPERVAGFLADLRRRSGRPAALHLPMRLADIADHLGLRPETVSRCFTDLRRQGVIGTLGVDGILPLYRPEALPC
ncbi:Crp/Fnr family transcriptional regulator [Magnetospirillum sp. UT-4]|uniref:Crp/Fnr family transcriptional regulator n=1 Tax=Magnetospirillum sp. UT-4 TaxID=2681467 RepID=UPI00138370BA|nr:Crp/Fnr family transcriptional regulator [Magnetospirillum sp. UT-4]CAA7615348.1 putative Nitrogen fixation regulation protein FixK [Magnetospirillum sp. UT-4]